MKNIAILASGNGSNAESIIKHFKDTKNAIVALVASNKPEAFVLERAKKHHIPYFTFNKSELNSGMVRDQLIKNNIDLVVLAGFLLKVPDNLIESFPDSIINIHPALLPKFGGKGMYGSFVHKAVKEMGETKSGITIHYVNNHYDEGKIIFQESVDILPDDSPGDIATKVQVLEHKYFPKVIESLL